MFATRIVVRHRIDRVAQTAIMAMMRDESRPARPNPVTLFFGALGDIARHRADLARILAVPIAAMLLVEAISAYNYVQWLNAPGYPPPPLEIGRSFILMAMVGVIAVAWHRLILIDEAPSGLLPPLRPGKWAAYILGWIVIGILVGLLTLICVVLPLVLIGGFVDPYMAESLFSVTELVAPWPDAEPGLLSEVYFYAAIAVSLLFYLYMLFRVSMGLPAAAIGAASQPGLRASFRRTRPLALPILGVAILALLAQGVATAVQLTGVLAPVGEQVQFASYFPQAAIAALIETAITVIGAAILTRIYEASAPEASAAA